MNPLPLASSDFAARQSTGLPRWRRLQRYSFAVLSVAVALGAALLLDRLGFRDATVPLFICAGAISSWYGGRGPAVQAVVLCSLAFDYFFVPPLYTLYICTSGGRRFNSVPGYHISAGVCASTANLDVPLAGRLAHWLPLRLPE